MALHLTLLDAVDDDARPAQKAGMTMVVAVRRRRRRLAQCSCGWRGRWRRLAPSVAVLDALLHVGDGFCEAADPLVRELPCPDGGRENSAAA